MKTYISDIIPRIQKFSQKLDNLTLLMNQHWVVIDDIDKTKNVYIFRQNNELIISQNGKVEKSKWEYLGHNSLLIERSSESYLLKHGFFDENILALKIDSKEEYVFLVNETNFDKEMNSSLSVFEFLNKKYINPDLKRNIIRDSTNLPIDFNQDTLLPEYQSPNYSMLKVKESHSLLGPKTEMFVIEFEDGEKGEIYFRTKNKQAYFKEKRSWTKREHYYENIEFCINALYHYLTTDKILSEGFIMTYN